MLLIPGTFDSNIEKRKKEDEEIMLIQKWDRSRPRMVSPVVDFLLRPYVRYDDQADSKAFLICKWCFWCASCTSKALLQRDFRFSRDNGFVQASKWNCGSSTSCSD